MSGDIHLERARRRLLERSQERRKRLEGLRRQAAQDAEAIAVMIAARYKPVRIYQWGSVLRPGGFQEYSDVDIAVEGVSDAAVFFRMLEDAQAMTRMSLDLVQLEKIEPEYAEEIRQHGRVVYERP